LILPILTREDSNTTNQFVDITFPTDQKNKKTNKQTNKQTMTIATSADYQDAIMFTEEARLLIRKVEDDDNDERQRKDYIRLARSLYLRVLNIQEAISGWCSEDTARIYYELGWLEYEHAMNSDRALGYWLQSLRISYQIYGNDDPATLVILDDIQDLLEDMNLDNEYANRVFRSWELQDQAEEAWEDRERETRDDDERSSLDYRIQSPVLEFYQQALDQLPMELELERAVIYCRMASFASQQRFSEDALSYYCSALMRLPNWLSHDHPRVRAITKESRQVAREQLTPICGVPAIQEQVQQRDPASWRKRPSLYSAPIIVVNE
jgi:tetratricopeptide (TPR) repeat protein